MNGDGFGDLIIGAEGGDPNGAAGESYVVFGRAPDGPVARVGSAADQYISGGAFGDSLSGLDGDDRLEGRGGGDSLDGGPGRDTAVYAHSSSGVSASLRAPGGNLGDAAGDTYISIDNLVGTGFADVLSGNGLANAIFGGNGNDRLRGRGGNDVLVGGIGMDVQTGGNGADTFRFTATGDTRAGAARDRITDFNAGSPGTSVDKIDLRPIDSRIEVVGNQAFSFIGTAAFSGISGQLRITLKGTTTIVSGDVNGDSIADFRIALLNVNDLANLTAIDFVR